MAHLLRLHAQLYALGAFWQTCSMAVSGPAVVLLVLHGQITMQLGCLGGLREKYLKPEGSCLCSESWGLPEDLHNNELPTIDSREVLATPCAASWNSTDVAITVRDTIFLVRLGSYTLTLSCQLSTVRCCLHVVVFPLVWQFQSFDWMPIGNMSYSVFMPLTPTISCTRQRSRLILRDILDWFSGASSVLP